MSDYISREKAIAVLKTYDMSEDNDDIEFKCAIAMAIKALDNKGEWIEWKGRKGRYNGIPICSNCNTAFPIFAKDYNFCPNCGCQMNKENNNVNE